MKKFSNLTFGGYLAGTTSVIFVKFSSISVLCRFCLEHMRTIQLTDGFQHHQLASSMGNGRLEASHTTASRTKSCMVLTSLMATANNHQGDEPRTIALERQVQTLIAAEECLTKHNHDLEEQLRQKNAALNT